MSSTTKPKNRSKNSKRIVPPAKLAWSKGPPQPPRPKSPGGDAPPETRSRRQSAPGHYEGQISVTQSETIGSAFDSLGHRPTSSLSVGSTPKFAVISPPTIAPKTQPPAAVVIGTKAAKSDAPTLSQTVPANFATSVDTLSRSSAPHTSTPTPQRKKLLNIHELFRSGDDSPASPTAATPIGHNNTPSVSGYSGRGSAPFPRSAKIPRQTTTGPQSGDVEPLPGRSHGMSGTQIPVPLLHHQQRPQRVQPQWGQQPHYYPQGFDPHQQHCWPQQPHYPHAPHPPYPYIPPYMQNSPILPSPPILSSQTSAPPVSANSSDPPAPSHAPSPVNTPSPPSNLWSTTNPPAAPTASAGLGVSRIRSRASIRITTLDGSPVRFEPLPKVSIGRGQGDARPSALQKQRSVAITVENLRESRTRIAAEEEKEEKKRKEEEEKRAGRESHGRITNEAMEELKSPLHVPISSMSYQNNNRAGFPRALANAKAIEDLNTVVYPDGVKAPNGDLKNNIALGRLRYDREFLLQFMNVCTGKPGSLAPLSELGLDPSVVIPPSVYPSKDRSGRRGNKLGKEATAREKPQEESQRREREQEEQELEEQRKQSVERAEEQAQERFESQTKGQDERDIQGNGESEREDNQEMDGQSSRAEDFFNTTIYEEPPTDTPFQAPHEVFRNQKLDQSEFRTTPSDISGPASSKEATERLAEDVIKLCSKVEDIDRGITILQSLPDRYKHILVEKSITVAFDSGLQSIPFFEKLFAVAHVQHICAPKVFERGFLSAICSADDTSTDMPRTYEWLARLMHAAGISKARVERLADRIVVFGDPKIPPKYLLVYEYEKMLT